MAGDLWPNGTHVRCIDPTHRDHQHSRGVGTILHAQQSFVLGSNKAPRTYEVAWTDMTRTYTHDAHTLMRVYSRAEIVKIKSELEAQLHQLRQEI